MYQTNVQHNQHLTNNQLPVERYTNAHARGTCKHSNTQSIQTYVWKTTHKQNIADHKLVTQKIKHGATNHTTHIVYPNTMLYMHNRNAQNIKLSTQVSTYNHTNRSATFNLLLDMSTINLLRHLNQHTTSIHCFN